MNVVDLFATALEDFTATAELTKPDQWSNETPCTEWDVRALTKHLVYELVWMPPMLAGKTIEEVGDAFEGDILGDDPVKALRRAGEEAEAAVRRPGAMEAITHLSFGDYPGKDYTEQVLFDLVIHGWDLRKGIGADPTLRPALVEGVWDWAQEWLPRYRAGGVTADVITLPQDASMQDRLIGMTGRSPAWPD